MSRGPLRLVSMLVLAILVASTAGLALVARSLSAGEEQRLLQERAGETAMLVESLFAPVTTTLPNLVAEAPPRAGATSAFTAAARHDLASASDIGVLEETAGSFRLLAAVGTGPGGVSRSVGGGLAGLARRALEGRGEPGSLIQTAAGTRLSFALAAGPGLVVYEELAFDPHKVYNLGSNGPFSQLDGALYASARPSPATLLITTTAHLPLVGSVATQPVQIGTIHGVMVVKSLVPLVGSFAAGAPWVVLGGGLLAALLATLLVETLVRRRSYALGLVEERTAALREAREAADAANRAKSEFLSRMSHELRTPLNAILGFGQLLEIDDLGGDQQESVNQILRGGRHLLGLINEILDISRIETGTLTLSPEPVSVGEVVAEVVGLLGPLTEDRGIVLVAQDGLVEDPDRHGHVVADRQRLKQILLNLVANAIKYNRDAGTVAVGVDPIGPATLRITVTDTGPGIAEEDLAKLFVPFERLGAEASGVEGAGVGLALCRRLAEAMGGSVGVSSRPGEGSCFWVQLPMTEGPLERYERLHGPPVDLPAPEVADAARHPVLYIEDNLSNLRLIERVLARYDNLEVVPAMQGRLGLSLAHEHHPAVILLDLNLPDLSGEEVLRQLRDDPATADVPVIVISADATPGQVERLLAGGANAYLTKPLDVRQLIEVLADQLGIPLAVQAV